MSYQLQHCTLHKQWEWTGYETTVTVCNRTNHSNFYTTEHNSRGHIPTRLPYICGEGGRVPAGLTNDLEASLRGM